MPIDRKWITETKARMGEVKQSGGRTEFEDFKIRVLNLVEKYVLGITEEGIHEFCQVFAEPVRYINDRISRRPDPVVVVEKLQAETDARQFLFLLQVILKLPFVGVDEFYNLSKDSADPGRSLLVGLREVIRLSDVDVDLTMSRGHAILRPRGEKVLEKALVEDVLSFLQGAARDHFVEARRSYGKDTRKERVRSAEALRRSLEEFLRFEMSNTKGLDSNIKELELRLKQEGRDASIRNIIFHTFNYLDLYFNNNSKHKDGRIDAAENEYLIYQAGLLMRHVHRVLE